MKRTLLAALIACAFGSAAAAQSGVPVPPMPNPAKIGNISNQSFLAQSYLVSDSPSDVEQAAPAETTTPAEKPADSATADSACTTVPSCTSAPCCTSAPTCTSDPGCYADSGCGCTACTCGHCGCGEPWRLFSQDGDWKVTGWLNAGVMGNGSTPASRFHGPYNAIDRDEGMFNQAYFILDKALPGECDIGWGARVDLLYGFDYYLAQSTGLENHADGTDRWNSSQYYGLALPQAYVSVGNQVTSIKFGHFYSIVGYEGVPANSNFFYSKTYSYQFAGPFTHWGALLNHHLNDNWEVNAGIHNGWNQLDGIYDTASFIGSLKYTSDCQDWWSSFAVTTGKENNDLAGLGFPQDYSNRTRYSFIVDKKFGNCTEYLFHQWFGSQENGTATGDTAYWYGIDQYLFYTLDSQWKAALRAEWFRDEDGTRVGLNRPANPNKPPYIGNFWSITAGLNYQWTKNFMLRPEARFDWFDGAGVQPYDDGNDDSQFTYGFDAIWQF